MLLQVKRSEPDGSNATTIATASFSNNGLAIDPIHIGEARDWIATLTADGGTEMQPALASALDLPRHAGALRLIEPPAMLTHDVGAWNAAHGSTTKMPERPLVRRSCFRGRDVRWLAPVRDRRAARSVVRASPA